MRSSSSLIICVVLSVVGDVQSYYVARMMGFPSDISDNFFPESSPHFLLFSRTRQKKNVASAKPLLPHEDVCEMKIRQNYRPKFGHEHNGTRVEIQQDSRREFHATFVECEDSNRASCHGIDGLFSSECVTVYGLQPAGIRIEGSTGEFSEGLIKVPVACQCRLRRKINLVLTDE